MSCKTTGTQNPLLLFSSSLKCSLQCTTGFSGSARMVSKSTRLSVSSSTSPITALKRKNGWVCHVCALLNSTSSSCFLNFIFSHFTCFLIPLPSHTSLLYHVTINFICLSCDNSRACSCVVSYFNTSQQHDHPTTSLKKKKKTH